MVRKHYEEMGRPKSHPMNNFKFPPEITKELGPLIDEPASIDECLHTI
jgi:hypothetical protein